MARYKKKRVRELQHDRFRDTTISIFDRLGTLLEGRGKDDSVWNRRCGFARCPRGIGLTWSRRKADEARRALGRGIAIASTPVTPTLPLRPRPAATQPNRSGPRKRLKNFKR